MSEEIKPVHFEYIGVVPLVIHVDSATTGAVVVYPSDKVELFSFNSKNFLSAIC